MIPSPTHRFPFPLPGRPGPASPPVPPVPPAKLARPERSSPRTGRKRGLPRALGAVVRDGSASAPTSTGPAAELPPVESLRAPRVLVVEDNQAFRTVVSLLLIREGYEVLTASNGEAALGRIQTWEPDVIVLDMMMPVMGGEVFLRTYRERIRVPAPTIAVTSSPEEAERAGADYVLGKPADMAELLRLIGHYTRWPGR